MSPPTSKFALAKALLDLNPAAGSVIPLEEIAVPFALHVAAHLKDADKQGTSARSQFLDACRQFNAGQLTQTKLVERAIRLGFNNVLDAFHVVGAIETPVRFFLDERRAQAGIRMTEEFARLTSGTQVLNLPAEVEARWRLVETARELGVARGLVSVAYDPSSEALFAIDHTRRRQSVTSSRSALNGYQKGRCFYCVTEIHVESNATRPDVDHFFPHALKQTGFGPLVDGVWNLVLACRECNRGVKGKAARVPTLRLLERLWRRNEYLISSHHPLSLTLRQQTGSTEQHRRAFLNDWHSRARAQLLHQWEPEHIGPDVF